MERREHTIGVFLDFSKALDTVNHEILLAKLNGYGIRVISNLWIRNYLKERLQYCNYNGTRSEPGLINCGVPQGSVLGPLLFLIYINDLGYVSPDVSLIMFADDSNLFASDKDLTRLQSRVNHALEQISEWLIVNHLSLNVMKTHFMHFRPVKNNTAYNINIVIGTTHI